MRSKVGRSRDSLTRVVARAVLKVSRCSRPISEEAARASIASLGEMRSSALLRSPMNSRILWSIRFWGGAPPVAPPPDPATRLRTADVGGSFGEGDPGGLEDILVAVATDGAESPVLEPQQTVKGAPSDQVRHLELPAEGAVRRLLLPLEGARHVRHVADQVQHTHGSFGAAQT